MTEETLAKIFAQMVGHVCEEVDNPTGSILRLYIGQMSRLADDALPTSKPHGWRHFTIMSPWRLQNSSTVICDWTVTGGKHGSLGKYITVMMQRRVVSIGAIPPAWDLQIEFDNDLSLFVFSDATNDRDSAWFLLGTDGLVLNAAPQMDDIVGLNADETPEALLRILTGS